MEEERRAACAEKLKRLDEKQQQQGSGPAAAAGSSKTPGLDGNSTAVTAGSPSPSISASSPNISQPASPCVDPEEPPVLAAQSGSGSGASDRRRASSNSSYDSTAGQRHTHEGLHSSLTSFVCLKLKLQYVTLPKIFISYIQR